MRNIFSLNQNWKFSIQDKPAVTVDVPHTWNAIDGQDGGNDYYRGVGIYEKIFQKPTFDEKTQDVYLEFCGVNATATVTLGGQQVAYHDGGYSTFRVKVTPYLQDENMLQVAVDNTVNTRVYPQKADFTFYGGIYRDVNLLVVSKNHFELDYYGMPGMQITPSVAEDAADVKMEGYVYLDDEADAAAYTVMFSVCDALGNVILEEATALTDFTFDQERFGAITSADSLKGKGRDAALVADVTPDFVPTAKHAAAHTFHMDAPHLWNGVSDPYLYTAKATLLCQGTIVDEIIQRFGVRSFAVYPDKGFYLNGKPYPLHGVSRHQDFKGIGNAIPKEQHKKDMELIKEIGANTIRLAHYQHDQYFYDLCDEEGMIVWAEIPYISEHIPSARANTITQMRELILQNYNHASIVTWGLSNEITISTHNKKDMLDNHHVLNDLCHNMDAHRVTSLACYAMCNPFGKVVHISDIVSYNLYLGWYVPGLFLNDIFFALFHLRYPKRSLGYSEYGAEGMPNLHSEHPHRGDHTEEYQAKYHEYMVRCFARFPWIWATHVWNMFDFAADARDQGGEPGMNHKGLVTFDRQTKKDSFYLYKSYWNAEPMVHICSKRFVERKKKTITVKVYSNQPSVSFYCNDKLIATKEADHVFNCKITLTDGENHIRVVAGDLEDTATFVRTDAPANYKLSKKRSKSANWV